MMHSYRVSGMTCVNCQTKIEKLLGQVPGVTAVQADWQLQRVQVSMDQHVSTPALQQALQDTAYTLSDGKEKNTHSENITTTNTTESALKTYWPIFLIFFYITGFALLVQARSTVFDWHAFMRHFMAGFFIVFSFFKFLDLRGFAESYATYDLLAKRWQGYGYVYAILELGLGCLYVLNIFPIATNAFTFILMCFSLAGVLISVLNKQKIRCACLGTVFNLPMSTVTIVEDVLMIVMSAAMLVPLISILN